MSGPKRKGGTGRSKNAPRPGASKDNAEELRKQAEERLSSMFPKDNWEINIDNVRGLLQELRVHQIELEMQNEEMRATQVVLEESRLRYSDLYDFAPVGYMTFDRKGVILEANLTACAQLGLERKFVIGTPILGFLAREDADRFFKHVSDVLDNEKQEDVELGLKPKKGPELRCLLKSIPWRDAEGDLQLRSSITDITKLKLAEEALAESEDRHKAIFHQARDGIVIIDLGSGRILDCNPEFEKQTGRGLEDLREMRIWELRPPGLVEAARMKFDEIKSKGEVASSDLGFLRADGGITPVDFVSRVVTIRGERCILAITRDIAERKRSEDALRKAYDEREVLLKEVHHRVKNNLMVISSLLSMQAARVDDERFGGMIKDAQQRIRSMSLIHEKLYRASDFAKVSMGDYLRGLADDQLRSYGAGKKISLALDVPEGLDMGMDIAIPCALIISEFVSNSLKYAFPDGREGKISVSLHGLEGDAYELELQDDGVGLPEGTDLMNTDTLGLNLIVLLAQRQLNGTINPKKGNGTGFIVRFDLQEIENG